MLERVREKKRPVVVSVSLEDVSSRNGLTSSRDGNVETSSYDFGPRLCHSTWEIYEGKYDPIANESWCCHRMGLYEVYELFNGDFHFLFILFAFSLTIMRPQFSPQYLMK